MKTAMLRNENVLPLRTRHWFLLNSHTALTPQHVLQNTHLRDSRFGRKSGQATKNRNTTIDRKMKILKSCIADLSFIEAWDRGGKGWKNGTFLWCPFYFFQKVETLWVLDHINAIERPNTHTHTFIYLHSLYIYIWVFVYVLFKTSAIVLTNTFITSFIKMIWAEDIIVKGVKYYVFRQKKYTEIFL